MSIATENINPTFVENKLDVIESEDLSIAANDPLIVNAEDVFNELMKTSFDKDTVRHYVIKHKSRSLSFTNAVSFKLKSKIKNSEKKTLDTAAYLLKLVENNFNKDIKIVNAIEDDGSVRLNDNVWGYIDLENVVNITLKTHLTKLIYTTKVAEDNPNKNVDTSKANIGVVKLSCNENKVILYAIQRTTDVGRKAIDSTGWFRNSKNEAYIVEDTRYRIEPYYDFFILKMDEKYSVFIRNFKNFELTANFAELQNHNVKKGLEALVSANIISEVEKSKLSSSIVSSMGVREKSHLIKAISSEQYIGWSSLKEQHDLANEKLPADKKWSMQFNDNGEFVFDGQLTSLNQFVKFISHTIVISASDNNFIRDISGWVEDSPK